MIFVQLIIATLIDEHARRHVGVDNETVTITAIIKLNVPCICLDGYNIKIEKKCRNYITMGHFNVQFLRVEHEWIFYMLAR